MSKKKNALGQIRTCEASLISNLENRSAADRAAYFSKIGRLGGLGGKGSQARKQSAQNAAHSRWEQDAIANRTLVIHVEANRLKFSRNCPEVEGCLSVCHHRRQGAAILPESVKYLFPIDSGFSTLLPLLTRIERALKATEVPYRVAWRRAKPPKPQLNCKAISGMKSREVRALRTLRRHPFGGVLIARDERLTDLLISLVLSYPDDRVIVVVNSLHKLSGIRHLLQQSLGELVGALTHLNMDDERVVLTTPQQFNTRVLPNTGVGLLVFVDPPKKCGKSIQRVFEFTGAFRVGLTSNTEIKGIHAFHREALFGPPVEVLTK